MKMKEWFRLIKENIVYLIVFLLGLVLSTIGGMYLDAGWGMIILGIGIFISFISAILGLRNKDLEWEEFD